MIPRSPVELADLTPARLRAALDGEPAAVRATIAALTPYVQVRVARVLYRHRGRAAGRNLRQEVEDLVQETFIELFENDARTLRSWDPARGLPLSTFVQVIAERTALSILRSGKRSPWTEDPTDDAESGASPDSSQSPDRRVASRDLVVRVLDRLKEELSPRGWEIFNMLFVEEREVTAICEALSMNADAVYAWRSRLGKRIRNLLDEIDPPSDRRAPIATKSGEAGA